MDKRLKAIQERLEDKIGSNFTALTDRLEVKNCIPCTIFNQIEEYPYQ